MPTRLGGPRLILLSVVVGIFSTTGLLQAQAPSLSRISPQGIPPGQTSTVTLRGKNLAGAEKLWTSFPATVKLAPDVKDNGTNESRVVFQITPGDKARLGVHGIRVITPRGVSPIRLFLIDDLPSVSQQGNNKTRSQAQELKPPVAVDGRMPSLSRHFYTFHAQAGQRLSMEVVARRMGSALDPMIRLLDPQGKELTYSDDEPGLSSDCRLCLSFPRAGQYTLEVRDIRYQGGGNYDYRLRIGDYPCVTVPYPMGLQRGTEAKVSFAGHEIQSVQPLELKVPSEPHLEWMTVGAKRAGGQSSGFATLSLSDSQELTETEPNDKRNQANRVDLGANLNGRFAETGDVDHFIFHAPKGDKWTFQGVTRRQGSPADLIFRLLNDKGKQLARSDDQGRREGMIRHTFSAEGNYILAVEDLHRRGGTAFAYRIEVKPTRPGFRLSASSDRLNIPAGGTAQVTVNADRQGYNGPIELEAVNLPEGAKSVPTVIGPKRSNAILTVQAGPTDSPKAAMSEIHIVGTAQIGGSEFQRRASIKEALKSITNGMPWPPAILEKAMAAAVGPQAPVSLQTASPQVVFGRHLTGTITIQAERQKGYDGKVKLALLPDKKKGLPGGIQAKLKPIPKGKNEVEIAFSANQKAPLGEYTAVLKATTKKDKQSVTQPVPGIRLKLQQPFKLAVEAGDGQLARNDKLTLKVRLERNPAFSGPVTLSVPNLPKGVSAKETTVPADKKQAEIILKAEKDAKQATVKDVTVKGQAKAGKADLSATSSSFSLTVQ